MKLIGPTHWQLIPRRTARGVKRAGATADSGAFFGLPDWLLLDGAEIVEAHSAVDTDARRTVSLQPIGLEADVTAEHAYIVVARHPSDALTFHPPVASQLRGRGGLRTAKLRFEVPALRGAPPDGALGLRRGIITKGVELFLVQIARKLADRFAPAALAALERKLWGDASLGFVRASKDGLAKASAPPVTGEIGAGPSGRALLLIHGAFSSTANAYKAFAVTDFLDRVASTYGDHIYGFDHLTLSETPLENARQLLDRLPKSGVKFDVVTHSRGGLVLSNILGSGEIEAGLRSRFTAGSCVLVASPNQGTPLATPSRWRDTIGWFANLIEMFPDNPLTTAPEFVANGLVWLAEAATAYLPGLAAMDAYDVELADLQRPPNAHAGDLSALVANYTPAPGELARLADMGLDSFFGGANDLLVPTEGGWKIDRDLTGIPGSQIGCFGGGGNIGSDNDRVNHLNIMAQKRTAEFVARALAGQPQGLSPIDVHAVLGDRRAVRGVGAASPVGEDRRQQMGDVDEPQAAPSSGARERIPDVYSDALHIFIIEQHGGKNDEPKPKLKGTRAGGKGHHNGEGGPPNALLAAAYGGARVVTSFHHQAEIERYYESIKKYVDGVAGATEPDEKQLLEFGTKLFEWVFPNEVRPLYDVARTLEYNKRLNIVFTCMIPEFAVMPLEFAYDPLRKTFLATEEIHFIRNVLTAVPADKIKETTEKLRMLIVIAQPIGLVPLSAEEEQKEIKRGFAALEEAGLAEVDVLRAATPAGLHRWMSSKHYDIVHFIGHGDWDDEKDEGLLLFEDGRGNRVDVPIRTAREVLCQRGVKLIFLNACDSGRDSYVDFNSGIAQALVAGGVPAVVANQFKVFDPSANTFAQYFYWALAQGQSIGAAAREARISVNCSLNGESIDWAIPVVYARDPDGRLCPPRKLPPDFNRTPARTVRARRGSEGHVRQVAVWDVNYVFPGLQGTLERMNNADQHQLGFQLVDTSTPAGTWRKANSSGDSCGLDPHRAARRLRGKTAELGVDFLLCITDKVIFDVGYEGAYAWWWTDTVPEKLPRNIVFFSTAIKDLPWTGCTASRVVANAAVRAIAATAGELKTHEAEGHGPAKDVSKQCPMYKNVEADLRYVAGPLIFCPHCRELLYREKTRGRRAWNERIGFTRADGEALETLLKVFAPAVEENQKWRSQMPAACATSMKRENVHG